MHAFFCNKKFCINSFCVTKFCTFISACVASLLLKINVQIFLTQTIVMQNFDAKNDAAKIFCVRNFGAKNFCVTVFCLFIFAKVYSAAYIFVYLIKMTI